MLLGLTQAAQSWKMHKASNLVEYGQNKKIIIAEATNGALVGALFLTVSTANIFDGDGVPDNGMAETPGMVNLYYTLNCTATFCFAMGILYSLALLLIMESLNEKDASEISHALGMGIHWPITNFVIGILLLLGALFLKGYFDVDFWVWITGIMIMFVQICTYFVFLAIAVQAQWDLMDKDDDSEVISQISPDVRIAQQWVSQLSEIDDETIHNVCACFKDQLVDVYVLADMTASDFALLGVSKIGWQKNLVRRARQELATRHGV